MPGRLDSQFVHHETFCQLPSWSWSKTVAFSLLRQEASTPGMRSGAVSTGRYTCQGRVSETVEIIFQKE